MSYPEFLLLPIRDSKPRRRGVTHVLDKALPPALLSMHLEQSGHLIDILKIGWGLAYIDPAVKERVALCADRGVQVSLGGTLLELCAAQGRVDEFRKWAIEIGVDCVEVSNGLQALSTSEKSRLIRTLSRDFIVLAETGAKSADVAVRVDDWLPELESDLEAGATWLIAEGRESGTVGLYDEQGRVRSELVDAIAERLPTDRLIFEAPLKAQQLWFQRRFGPGASLGNVPVDQVLELETLRLGLRADTADLTPHPEF